MLGFLRKLFGRKPKNKPAPGLDGRWFGNCPRCQDMTGHASRGGLQPPGKSHCYECGLERPMFKMKVEESKRMATDAWAHWRRFPIIPYNWHQLSESERWTVLCGKIRDLRPNRPGSTG